MRFGVLGPVLVHDGDTLVDIRAPRQRTLLAALVVQVGRAVPAEKLAEELWDAGPPAAAAVTLRTHVMRLREVLGLKAGARLLTRSGCYQLDAGEAEVDHLLFAALCSRGCTAAEAGRWRQADRALSDALGLWRGAPLADIASECLRSEAAPHLEQLHLQALEWRNDARLSLARHSELLTELQALVAENPLRERFHAQLMLALYRCGRQADALSAFQHARHLMVEELGIEPGPELRELHQRMLAADRSLEVRHQATALVAPVDAVPQQLPPAVRNFTGRQREMDALAAELDQADIEPGPRTLVISAISGTAGVGKTALALQWAHQFADRFPDGQLYVNLRGYDPGQPMSATDALARFLRDLGVAGSDIPAEEEERAARYRSLLAGRRMLIVLDNAGQAGQVRPLLPGRPECTTVVTSRDALAGLVARDGARRLDLDLLPFADAISLLQILIGARVDAEPDAAAALAAFCGRLPLALRIAAELAVARPAASLASLAAELAGQQHRLDLLDAGGDPRTGVRTVFSWSIRHLDPGTARAFGLLGLHPGPDLDAYAAAALTGTSLQQARGMLDQLMRAHLIQATGPGRHGMHDLLREYARELAADDGHDEQQAALTRLFDYYLHGAAAAMDTLYPAEQHQRPRGSAPAAIAPRLTEPGTAGAWLAAELPCLVAVAVHAATDGWPAHAIDLAATLFRYLDADGHFPEAVIIHGHARRAAQQTGDVAAEARALIRLGTAESRKGRYQRAAGHFEQALALSRQAGDRDGEARAYTSLGNVAYWQGRYEQAIGYHQLALSQHRESGNRIGEATALSNLGLAEMRPGRFQQSVGHLQQALALHRDTGNQRGEVHVLLNLGEVSLRQGRHEQAAPYLQQALALARDASNRVAEAAGLASLGELDLRQGRYQHAARRLQEALALARDIGAHSTETEALNLLGEGLLATGDHAQARIHHGAALALASQTGDTYWQARAHDGLARIHHAVGDLEQARHHWQLALTLYTEMASPEADQVRAQLAGIQGPEPSRIQ
jgi:DNA-binding SARP family transcriptional activator/Tfp pilus assembly protein PilF